MLMEAPQGAGRDLQRRPSILRWTLSRQGVSTRLVRAEADV